MEVFILGTLVGAVKELYEIAVKIKENREQCLRLCLHINSVLDVLQDECSNGVPPRLSRRMIKLSRCENHCNFERGVILCHIIAPC